MNYIRVKWKHSFPDEAVLLYSELDQDRWEVRKVEIFPDGHRGYASSMESFGGTEIGLVQIPSLEEIAADPQFEPVEISPVEFERVWAGRHENPSAI